MEFSIIKLCDGKLALCLEQGDDFFINVKVNWITDILIYNFKDENVLENIFEIIKKSEAQFSKNSYGEIFDLTDMKIKNRENLINQLNSILLMEELIR